MSRKNKRKIQNEQLADELEMLERDDQIVDDVAKISDIIQQHWAEIEKAKRLYLDDSNSELYAIYSNIDCSFAILVDDLKENRLWTPSSQ